MKKLKKTAPKKTVWKTMSLFEKIGSVFSLALVVSIPIVLLAVFATLSGGLALAEIIGLACATAFGAFCVGSATQTLCSPAEEDNADPSDSPSIKHDGSEHIDGGQEKPALITNTKSQNASKPDAKKPEGEEGKTLKCSA
ncbi:MAG: hypothetical protein V4490_04860 [Pseudomonadota bacterium]